MREIREFEADSERLRARGSEGSWKVLAANGTGPACFKDCVSKETDTECRSRSVPDFPSIWVTEQLSLSHCGSMCKARLKFTEADRDDGQYWHSEQESSVGWPRTVRMLIRLC